MAYTTLNGVQLQIPTRGTRNWDAVMLATTWANIAAHDHTGNPNGNQLAAGALANNAVTDAKFRQSAGLSVVGRSANSTGNVADITAATDFHVLRRSGTAIGFGTLAPQSLTATTASRAAAFDASGFLTPTTATLAQVNYLQGLAGTASRVATTNGSGNLAESTVTTTELALLSGAIQQGTFTPAISPAAGAYSGLTYSTQKGNYQRIGSFLMFQLHIEISAITLNTASGAISITGLPIACKTDAGLECMFPVSLSRYDWASSRTFVTARLASGATSMTLWSLQDATVEAQSLADEVTTAAGFNKKIYISGVYPIS